MEAGLILFSCAVLFTALLPTKDKEANLNPAQSGAFCAQLKHNLSFNPAA
jgi:hypothetical protein